MIVIMAFEQDTPMIQAAPFFIVNRQSFAKVGNNLLDILAVLELTVIFLAAKEHFHILYSFPGCLSKID